MDNASIMRITAFMIQPEYAERFGKWVEEAYFPLLLSSGWVMGYDRYRILKEKPEYPRTISLSYWENINHVENFMKSPEAIAFLNDSNKTWLPQRGEVKWSSTWRLVKHFQSSAASSLPSKESSIQDKPIIHMEGYQLCPKEAENYANWFTGMGSEVFIPILMKLPGLRMYNYYKLIELSAPFREPDWYRPQKPDAHPLYLSLLHFENGQALDNYLRSAERAAFREGLKVAFPAGLEYKWYVHYQLMKSWRK